MQRNSPKRECILKCMKNTKDHPSAEWVYGQIKAEYPSVSLATVYRNIRTLVSNGAVRSVGIFDGKERFDAFTEPHLHAICTACGRIVDVKGMSISEETVKNAEAETGFTLSGANLVLSGICEDCKRKKSDRI